MIFDAPADVTSADSRFEDYLNYYSIDFHRQLPGVRYRMGGLSVAGYQIACQYWLPAAKPQATVLVVHGYFDHMALYGHLIRHLLERQYAVAAFDLPGHGLSSGERASIDSFASYVKVLDAVQSRLPKATMPLHAVGQSTGGAILLKRLWEEGDPFAEIVLLAPLIKPYGWGVGKLTYWLLRHVKTAVPRKFVKSCSNRAFLDFIATQDPMQSRDLPVAWVSAMKAWIDNFAKLPRLSRRLHIVQGDNDKTVAWRYNNRVIANKIAGTSRTLIAGAGHQLVNESDVLRKQIFAAMPL